jgi:hypothetical protein
MQSRTHLYEVCYVLDKTFLAPLTALRCPLLGSYPETEFWEVAVAPNPTILDEWSAIRTLGSVYKYVPDAP